MSDSEYEYEDGQTLGFTGVSLGFAGQEASKCELSPLVNHIGGSPIWFNEQGPDPSIHTCLACKKPMDLLCQLYCPWPDKNYDRALYVFACTDPKCFRKDGSVRAIRGVEKNASVEKRIAEETEPERPESNIVPALGNLGDMLFGSKPSEAVDSESSDTEKHDPVNEVQGKSDKKRKEGSSVFFKTKKRSFISVVGKYLCRHIAVDDEYIEEQPIDAKYANVEIEEAGPENTDSSNDKPNANGASGGIDELPINEAQMRGDPVFSSFVNVVENNPDQILRYNIGLKPVFYSGKDDIPKKLSSLKNQSLELQLMPQLISDLETDDMIAEGMEWGSIYVATDKNDTLPTLNENGVGYTEEWVGVQWEQE